MFYWTLLGFGFWLGFVVVWGFFSSGGLKWSYFSQGQQNSGLEHVVSQYSSLCSLHINSHFTKAVLASCALKNEWNIGLLSAKERKRDPKHVLLHAACLSLPKECRGLLNGKKPKQFTCWKKDCGGVFFFFFVGRGKGCQLQSFEAKFVHPLLKEL